LIIKPIIAICFLFAVSFLSACQNNDDKQVIKEGDAFPALTLYSPDGESVNTRDLLGKTLIINFWASWCTPCRKEMPDLEALSQSADASEYIVIGISVDEDINLMKEFILQNKIKFSNFYDNNQTIAQNILNIKAYPETFIVSPDGILKKRIIGQQRWNSKAMYAVLNSIHTGKPLKQGTWVYN
jgi:thiol-disulfide isomerase/thioredoxin